MRWTLGALLLLSTGASAQGRAPLPYRDPRLPTDARVHDLLGRMTPDEKFWQLYMIPGDLDDSSHDYSRGIFGLQIDVQDTTPERAARAHALRINGIQRYFVERTRLGIPIIPFEEAVHGLARPGATVFPQAIALAATWDTELVARVSDAIALETRSRGIRQVLSPVVNIASDVRWGRVEETYGEDPVLASAMGVAFVSAFERRGIVATPKHLVANVGEGGRDSYPIDVDRRSLEERFFPPFRAAIDRGQARSVMTAYNSVDGSPATQNRWLLTDLLKRAWGFSGFVISDAAATGGATVLHHTEASTATATQDAFAAGLDVVFQSSYPQHRPYLEAFRRGLVPDSVIDASVARVLRVKFDLGLFEHPYVNADSAALGNGNVVHRTLAREAAREAIVLLKNGNGALPLAKTVRAIAVIGGDASEARLGGYTGPGMHRTSILDGIRAAVGATVPVRFAAGPGRISREYVVVPAEQFPTGLKGEYFDNPRLEGQPRVTRTDARVDFGWTLNSPAGEIPYDWYSVRWTGTLAAPAAGVHRLGVEGNDGYRLFLDGRLVIDNWVKRSFGTRLADVDLAPGTTHDLRLEYFETTGNARVKLVWDAGVADDWRAKIDSAVTAARASAVAVIVAGIEEGEFRDRAFMGLPGHQADLIEAVAATGTPVIVVLVGGSAITMSPWLEQVAGVLDVWYPGEEGGHAVADVLFGDYNPAGRLPITFPMAEGQLPLYYNHKPTGRGDDYLDLTGQALFPFGFGLSYTRFEYSNLEIGTGFVRCRVKNVGDRAGDEVVQLYLHDDLASVAQPVIALKGFTRIHLAPGEAREVEFHLGPDELRLLDRDLRWVVEPRSMRVMVGASSKDIRLRGLLTVQ
ncbi:MAG TPA: glycoside hydrolase family 3 N-terminal domain-containing protein [Gemmatimonadales bacterium]|jgi:beta-glucosidase|nr:glycoside hydrolase family 3 N-terminal domain-containing protein [Gemmatimonadales bacterium]